MLFIGGTIDCDLSVGLSLDLQGHLFPSFINYNSHNPLVTTKCDPRFDLPIKRNIYKYIFMLVKFPISLYIYIFGHLACVFDLWILWICMKCNNALNFIHFHAINKCTDRRQALWIESNLIYRHFTHILYN